MLPSPWALGTVPVQEGHPCQRQETSCMPEKELFFNDNRDLREGSAVSQAGRAVPWLRV